MKIGSHLTSTMTRERAIEIAKQALAHETKLPDTENGEPAEWVIGAIMNAAHLGVCERFDASVLHEIVDAWIDLPDPGIVPYGFGEAVQRLVQAVGTFVGRDEMLKNPDVQRRGEIATVKTRIAWLSDQLKMARFHGIKSEIEKSETALNEAFSKAHELGIQVDEKLAALR